MTAATAMAGSVGQGHRLLSLLFQSSAFSKLRWLGVLVFLLVAAPAQALDMRVAVEENASQVQVGASTTAIIKNTSGQVLGRLQAMTGNNAQVQRGQVTLGPWNGSQVWVEPSGDGLIWIGDRWYRGKVLLTPKGQGLTAVNYVDVEEYLYSVVASEMPPSWPQEALKSQAVAARSYALKKRDTKTGSLFDVSDTTASQVYKGAAAETDSTRTAVKSTAGQILTYSGQVIEAVFHSSSGGHTENSEDVWSSPLPYLRGVPDYDQEAPVFSWSKQFTGQQLTSKIASYLGSEVSGIGNIVAIAPAVTSPTGRLKTVRIQGEQGSRTVSATKVRQALDLRSTLFSVVPQGGTKASNTTFVFQGRGFGHGIGMSQYGALGMAKQGQSYQQILGYYYQNTALAQMSLAQ